MVFSEEQVQEILQDLVKKTNLDIEIMAVVYREDYQHYLVVVGDVYYTDLREKLISDYQATNHVDLRNEIVFKLKNPYELDEFQKEEMGLSSVMPNSGTEQGIELDTSADNDWV